jgi:hypothetical protein
MRVWNSPSSTCNQPPSNTSTTSSLFTLLTLGSRWASQHTLDLRMLQDVIASGSGDNIHASFKKVSHRYRLALLPIETNQSHLWSKSKELQVAGHGLQGSGELTAIVAIALSRRGADPLTRVHVQGRGTCTYHLTTSASGIPRRDIRHRGGVEGAAAQQHRARHAGGRPEEWHRRQRQGSAAPAYPRSPRWNRLSILLQS